MHPASEPGAAALSAAYRYIDAHHRGDCGQTQNVLLFCLTGVPKQKDVQRNGVTNDLNAYVRAFWYALSKKRQIVVSDAAWHWLEGSSTPLSDVLVESSCARKLRDMMSAGSPPPSGAIVNALACKNNSLHRREQAVAELGLFSSVYGYHGHGGSMRNALTLEDVPQPFRAHGLYFWLQALTTYAIRLKGAAAARLQAQMAHVAHEVLNTRSYQGAHSYRVDSYLRPPACGSGQLDHESVLASSTVDGGSEGPGR